jgi:hypothetical protein
VRRTSGPMVAASGMKKKSAAVSWSRIGHG